MGCCNTNNKCLIVTTINPIWRGHPVHHGTKVQVLIRLKSKENITFAHNFIIYNKTQTKQLVVLIYNQVYFSLD